MKCFSRSKIVTFPSGSKALVIKLSVNSVQFNSIQFNMSSRKSVSKSVVQMPSCSFCKEAHVGFEFIQGKKIIKCPTLLNAVCPYCRGKGHTMKNCEIKQRDDANIARGAKERERERKRIEFEESQQKSKQNSVKNTSAKSRSVFSALEESSSDEESVPVQSPIQKETKKSYKDMAATIKEEPAPIVEEEVKEELAAPVVPKKKSILERLREPMPAKAPAPALKKDKEAIRLKRKEVIAKYKAEGKQIPWAIYDEYNTDSDSEDESD